MNRLPTPPLAVSMARLNGLGVTPAELMQSSQPSPLPWWAVLISGAGMLAGGYHGYTRNRGHWGWTSLWGLAGAAFPLPTVLVAGVQGYAKKK